MVYLAKVFKNNTEKIYLFSSFDARREFLDALEEEGQGGDVMLASMAQELLPGKIEMDDPASLLQRLVNIAEHIHDSAADQERQVMLQSAFNIANQST